MGQFIIIFDHPAAGRLYYGKGWRPYASKRSAVRFPSRSAAETRMDGVRKVFAHNPDFDQRLVQGMKVVPA